MSFYLPCCWASRKPIASVEFKFVAKQVVASRVIRAAKPKFVAEVELESTLRIMLPQLATLYFAARQVGTNAQQCVSTCNATMLQDKLKKNVARVTGP